MTPSMVLRLAALVLGCASAAHRDFSRTGWPNGNAGVDRIGGDMRVVACDANATAACCFDACLAEGACAAWSFELGGSGKCALKDRVPAPTVARDDGGRGAALVASGVKAAALQGLLPLAYESFPLGSIQTAGWLRTQLVLMTNGLSGHLELFWDDIADSVWIGGQHDHSGAGHERGPYWLNGVVPLAAHLNATGDTAHTTLNVDLQAQVNKWVFYILEHQNKSTGWLGPDDGFGGPGNEYWNGWNIAAALLQYADARAAAGNPGMAARCNKAVLDYVLEVHRRMLAVPSASWSQNRWQDWAYIIHWLLEQAPQGQEQALWDAAALTQAQSWDWDAYYAQAGVGTTGAYVGKPIPKFPPANVGGWTMYDHGVNNAMGTKSCATWYRQSANRSDADAAYVKLAMQDRYHGQPHGMFAADECFGGRELNRGIELCAVVEQMYSLQHNFRVLGDPAFMDRYERIAFNALPGTISPDQWQHQYLQQANEINAKYGLKKHVWQTDGDDSTGFGVAPNFGCCTANINQGWSKMASAVFMSTPADKGVVIALLAPASVRTKAGATVDVATDYPFGDTATITATPAQAADLPVHVRIPGWSTGATIAVDGGAAVGVRNGTMHTVVAKGGAGAKPTVIQLDLKPEIRLEKTWGVGPAPAPVAVLYDAAGATVPSLSAGEVNASDWKFSGGSGATNGKLQPPMRDIRSGDPGETTLAVLDHPIYGDGHALTSVSLSFQYIAGYSAPAAGATLKVLVLDAADHTRVLGTVYSSPGPLDKYSFDHFTTYSPPIDVASPAGMSIPNARPVVLALQFTNNGRNLEVPLLPSTGGLAVKVGWSKDVAPGPPPPVPPASGVLPGTNAVAVLRGPLLYTLELSQKASVVRTWPTFNNTDVNLEATAAWNYGLLLDDDHPLRFVASPGGPNKELPFNVSNYFAVIKASARALPGWIERVNAAEEPPASPVDCASVAGGCGDVTEVTLVPYGSTNLRMSGLPWFA
jgi:hypothetical protein